MLKFQNRDKILFIGDSVTDAGRGKPLGEGLWAGVGNGYVRAIDTMLNVYYPELLLHILNMGNGGNTTRDLLARWQNDVLDQKPDYVVLCIGFNDVWRQFDTPTIPGQAVPLDEYRANIDKMISLTKDSVKEMILMTPYYMEPNREDAMRAEMDRYTAACKEAAAAAQLVCIDLQAEFDAYLKYRHSSYIMWDRIHPGWIGSQIIARAFLRTVGFDRPLV